MVLLKLEDFDPKYRESFDNNDIKGMGVYIDGDLNDQDHQTFKLYQERLIANKTRTKTGSVGIGKHIETETARVSVGIDKERVVIERVTPADGGKT